MLIIESAKVFILFFFFFKDFICLRQSRKVRRICCRSRWRNRLVGRYILNLKEKKNEWKNQIKASLHLFFHNCRLKKKKKKTKIHGFLWNVARRCKTWEVQIKWRRLFYLNRKKKKLILFLFSLFLCNDSATE